jgi:hypothetical protein
VPCLSCRSAATDVVRSTGKHNTPRMKHKARKERVWICVVSVRVAVLGVGNSTTSPPQRTTTPSSFLTWKGIMHMLGGEKTLTPFTPTIVWSASASWLGHFSAVRCGCSQLRSSQRERCDDGKRDRRATARAQSVKAWSFLPSLREQRMRTPCSSCATLPPLLCHQSNTYPQ